MKIFKLLSSLLTPKTDISDKFKKFLNWIKCYLHFYEELFQKFLKKKDLYWGKFKKKMESIRSLVNFANPNLHLFSILLHYHHPYPPMTIHFSLPASRVIYVVAGNLFFFFFLNANGCQSCSVWARLFQFIYC